MTKMIHALCFKRDALALEYREKREQVQALIQAELDKRFDKDKAIKAAILAAEQSTEYCGDEYGEVYRWTRFEVPTQYKEFETELSNYFGEHGLHLDSKNDSLKSYCGECIIVNEDGDVFLNQEVIVDESDYRDPDGIHDKLKRNKLIEEYMEKSGFFPEVFRQTRYGDLFPINTQSKQGE